MSKTTFLTDKDLAERWHCHRQTLIRWRAEGTGPKYAKVNNKVLYKLSDIEAYEEQNTISHE
jgi:predicted site-specific integrase-resolvase